MRRLYAACLAWVLVAPAGAQTIPAKGTATTFEVATWNIEWFGSPSHDPADDGLQLRNVARVIRESDIDLWALQEIDEEDHFRALLEELGAGWGGELSSGGSNFKMAFVYKTGVIFVRQKASILTQFSADFAGRPPLQIEADVMLPDDTLRAVFITLHMKAFGDVASYDRRAGAALRLKHHVDVFLGSRPVAILGDFNDELSTSVVAGRDSPYAGFVADRDHYAFLTSSLDEDNAPTWCADTDCASGSTFDHILITDELFGLYHQGSTGRYTELLAAVGAYTSTTSDHLPVFARFGFAIDTGVQISADAMPFSVYPNPFGESTAVAFTTSAAGPAELTVYDVTGRTVRRLKYSSRRAGTHRFRVDGTGLAAGVYFGVLRHADGASIVRLIRTP